MPRKLGQSPCPSGSRKPRIAKQQPGRRRDSSLSAGGIGRRTDFNPSPETPDGSGKSVLPAVTLLNERAYTTRAGPIPRGISGERQAYWRVSEIVPKFRPGPIFSRRRNRRTPLLLSQSLAALGPRQSATTGIVSPEEAEKELGPGSGQRITVHYPDSKMVSFLRPHCDQPNGWRQRKPENLANPRSVLIHSQPDSIAIAAR